MNNKSDFLKTAIEAIKAAEKIILKYYSSGVEHSLKEDLSLVTAADREAEKCIFDILKGKFPDHRFLGEESDAKIRDSKGYIWVVDPIDGTANFVRGINIFASQIALMKDGEAILGVSNAPMLNEFLYAEKGKGAFLNDRPIKVSDTTEISKSYVSFGNIKHFLKSNKLTNLAELAKDARWSRGIGFFWSYHLLAQGKIDAIIDASGYIWDFAACKILVEEAGGKLTDMDGNEVNLGTRSAIATNGKLHNKIRGYFTER